MLSRQLWGKERALICGLCCFCGVNIATKVCSGCKRVTRAELGDDAGSRVHSCLLLQGRCPPQGQEDRAVTLKFLYPPAPFTPRLGTIFKMFSKLPCGDTHCSDWSLSITPEPPRTLQTLIHCRFSSKTPLVRVLGVSCNIPEQFFMHIKTRIYNLLQLYKQVIRYHTPSRKICFYPLSIFWMPSILPLTGVLTAKWYFYCYVAWWQFIYTVPYSWTQINFKFLLI